MVDAVVVTITATEEQTTSEIHLRHVECWLTTFTTGREVKEKFFHVADPPILLSPCAQQIVIALRYYYMAPRALRSRLQACNVHGVGEMSVSMCVQSVCATMARRMDNYIAFPTTESTVRSCERNILSSCRISLSFGSHIWNLGSNKGAISQRASIILCL